MDELKPKSFQCFKINFSFINKVIQKYNILKNTLQSKKHDVNLVNNIAIKMMSI